MGRWAACKLAAWRASDAKRWGTRSAPARVVVSSRSTRRETRVSPPRRPCTPLCALFPWCPKLLRFIRVCHLSNPATSHFAFSSAILLFHVSTLFSTTLHTDAARRRPPHSESERRPIHTPDLSPRRPAHRTRRIHHGIHRPSSLTPILARPQSYGGSHWRLTGQLTPSTTAHVTATSALRTCASALGFIALGL